MKQRSMKKTIGETYKMKSIGKLFAGILVCVSCALFAFGLATYSVGTLSVAVFCAWGVALLYAWNTPKKNLPYLFFLLTFFIFLLSRVMVRWIRFKEVYMPFSYDTMRMIYSCLFVSLLGLMLGNASTRYRFIIGNVKGNNTSRLRISNTKINIPLLRQICAIFTLVCGLATLAVVVEMAAFWSVSGSGGALRTSYNSTLPEIILRFSYAYDLMFCIYLATLPPKRQCMFFFMQYIAISALKMLYGSRVSFIVGLMFMLIYFSVRDRLNRLSGTVDTKWVGKKEKLFTIISIPLLIVLMVFVESYRTHSAFEFESFLNTMGDFFEAQGTSINVIGYTSEYQNEFTQPKFLYLFDNTYTFLTTNPIASIITGRHDYPANTVERALYGTSLGMTLYYYINRVSYLAGNGCGSSYVAEGWLGYGYFGLLIINFILARIIAKIDQYKYSNVIPSVVVLLFLKELFFMPRNNFDAFVGEMSGLSNIFFVLMLWVIYKLAKRRMARF